MSFAVSFSKNPWVFGQTSESIVKRTARGKNRGVHCFDRAKTTSSIWVLKMALNSDFGGHRLPTE